MTIANEVREEYIRLKAKADAIEAAIKPELDALTAKIRELDAPLDEVLEKMDELTDGAYVPPCEFCGNLVFEGDKHTPTLEGGPLCEECSPDLSDGIREYKEVLAEDGDGWDYYNFDSREEMAVRLAEMEAELAATGDRSMAHD